MANTAASTFITRALDFMSRISTGTSRSGRTMENMAMDWLNTALFRMSKKHDFRELYKQYTANTADGTKLYAMPSNWKVMLDLRVIDGFSSRKLKHIRYRQYDAAYPYPEDDTEDLPEFYIPFGNDFELYPIPDAVYAMYIKTIQWPTVITATTNLIDYEPNKDDLVLAYMLAEGFGFLQMLTDAAKWETTAKDRLKSAIELERRMPDWAPQGVGFDSIEQTAWAEDQYDTSTGQWIVQPFLKRKL